MLKWNKQGNYILMVHFPLVPSVQKQGKTFIIFFLIYFLFLWWLLMLIDTMIYLNYILEVKTSCAGDQKELWTHVIQLFFT